MLMRLTSLYRTWLLVSQNGTTWCNNFTDCSYQSLYWIDLNDTQRRAVCPQQLSFCSKYALTCRQKCNNWRLLWRESIKCHKWQMTSTSNLRSRRTCGNIVLFLFFCQTLVRCSVVICQVAALQCRRCGYCTNLYIVCYVLHFGLNVCCSMQYTNTSYTSDGTQVSGPRVTHRVNNLGRVESGHSRRSKL